MSVDQDIAVVPEDILVAMSQQVARRTEPRLPLLVLGAFAVQALASCASWFVVNDMSRGTGVFYNKDFSEWMRLSVVCAALFVVAAGLVLRRGLAVVAIAVGCALALMSGFAIFVGWAVLNSA